MQTSRKYLTLKELASRWGYTPNTLRNAVSRGTIPVRVSRLMPKGDPRFDLADVEHVESLAAEHAA